MIPEKTDEVPKGEDMYIDIGAKTKKQAEKYVSVGDFFVPSPKMKKLVGTRYIGRPFDDRVGCFVLIETLKNIKNTENDLYFVFSTQEEVGLRGSKTATYGVEPEIGIAVDVTRTGDKPSSKPMCVKLGEGPTVKIKDSSVICSPEIIKKIKEIATQGGIKVQDEVLLQGGTDTASMQITKCGVKVGAMSIPSAFIHSQTEMIDMADVKGAIKLLSLVCERI
jgi:endoglucanase